MNNFFAQNSNGVLEILGPTASGKTGLSIEIAKYLQEECGKGVEIICVDSRQVYRGCDISSAKPDAEEMQGIVHHGLDLVDLNQEYSVVQFQAYAYKTIQEILDRGNIPILCGGTMLWLDAVSEHFVFTKDRTVDGGFQKSNERTDPIFPFLKVGISWDRDVLYDRINQRAVQQFEGGLIKETQNVLTRFKPPLPWGEGRGEGDDQISNHVKECNNENEMKRMSQSAWTSFGYQEIKSYLEGLCTYSEALCKNQQRNRNYAKRQLTWWRGREDVHWISLA